MRFDVDANSACAVATKYLSGEWLKTMPNVFVTLTFILDHLVHVEMVSIAFWRRGMVVRRLTVP